MTGGAGERALAGYIRRRRSAQCQVTEDTTLRVTGHDAATRAAFRRFSPNDASDVGLGLRADKKIVDKIVKGGKMHP